MSTVSNQTFIDVYARQDGVCAVCGDPLDDSPREVHHMLRKADGGDDSPDNLVLLCDRDEHEYVHGGDFRKEIATTPELCRPALMPTLRDTLHRLSAYACREEEQRALDRLLRTCGQFERQGRTGWPVFSEAWLAFWQVWGYSREIALFVVNTPHDPHSQQR